MKKTIISIIFSMLCVGLTNNALGMFRTKRPLTLFTAPSIWKSNENISQVLRSQVYPIAAYASHLPLETNKEGIFKPKAIKPSKVDTIKKQYKIILDTPIIELNDQIQLFISPTAKIAFNGFTVFAIKNNINTLQDLQDKLSDNLRSIFRKFKF